jgi:hypothetical protein
MGMTLPVHDLAGDWQGTLSAGPQQLRLILKMQRADSATWNATLFSIDQSPDFGAGMAANVVTVRGLELNVTVNAVRGTYQGTFSADGTSIKGTWTQGQPLPLEFHRATPETAWKDPSPHSTQFVTVDRNVQLLETAIPRFQRALQEKQQDVQVTPLALLAAQASAAPSMPVQAVMGGVQKYSKIPVPILAIYAVPHDLGPLVNNDAAAREAMEVREEASVGAQAKAFEDGLPTAKVVRLPRANHYVFLSNEADVLREVNAFLAALSQ